MPGFLRWLCVLSFIFLICTERVCGSSSDSSQSRSKSQSHDKAVPLVKHRFEPNNLNVDDNKQGQPIGDTANAEINWSQMSLQGFWSSCAMIVVSEIGDKTFFIAAILAMKHSRFIVWLGASTALLIMTVIAVMFGSIILNFVPQQITHYGAGVLFAVFAIKLLYEGSQMKGGEASEELREVEQELKETLHKAKTAKTSKNDDVELGYSSSQTSDDDHKYKGKKRSSKWMELDVLIRSFVMTFVSEIGDRSQITTIVLAAHKSPYGVMAGAYIGHAGCTALAVIGGKFLASRISEKNVTLIGGFLFFVFSIETFVWGPL